MTLAPANFVGGPLDGLTIAVDTEIRVYDHEVRTVHRYDWAGGNTFRLAGQTVIVRKSRGDEGG